MRRYCGNFKLDVAMISKWRHFPYKRKFENISNKSCSIFYFFSTESNNVKCDTKFS